MDASNIHLPCSLVNEYKVALIEAKSGRDSHDTLTDKRMEICFNTLDDIIPKLGYFHKVIKAVRDDLFDGVYSNHFTSKQGAEGTESVARVPFFTLVKRIMDGRDERADELLTKIHELEERNQDSLNIIEQKEAKICNLRKAKDDLENQIEMLKLSVKLEKETITRLQSSLEETEVDKADAEFKYKEKLRHLQIELQASGEELRTLSTYKNSYDDLKDAFENPLLSLTTPKAMKIDEDQEMTEFRNPRIAQILKDLSVMETLENQLQFVRNCAIEEYDDFLEKSKSQFEISQNSQLLVKEFKSLMDDSELERKSQELVRTQAAFSEAILDIKAELTLLAQHRDMLKAELARLEQDDANKKETRQHHKGSARETASLEELDLVEIMVGNTEDPFVPHENILSKYSSMIYTSCNEGKTFYEIPDAKFCDSCGVKTLVCPHVVTKRERIFPLPKNCTHIKVVRPKIKLHKKRKRNRGETEKRLSTENSLLPRLKFVWKDFTSRTNVERKLQRILTENYVLSIIDQFYALVVWQDEYQQSEDDIHSILESFYNFLQDRYVLDDAVFLVLHDILCSVECLADTNKKIHLFAACLDGTLDAAAFRYVLLMNDFISSFVWMDMHDFTTFVSIVYPFLNEDDLEQLRMGYTSFSENKVSAFLVFNYLLYIVLNGREPRFLEFESKLLQCPVRKPGYFTDIEFTEAIDSFVPLASERLFHLLFLQSVKHFPELEETINVCRISHITSYLSLIQETPRIANSIKQWKAEKGILLKDSRGTELHGKPNGNEHHHIMTLSKIRLLGIEMGR